MNSDLKIEGLDWRLGNGPVLATAIHAGHRLRPGMAGCLRLPEPDRLREEDPFTNEWTVIGAHGLVVEWSRFDGDLNRPRENAVYAGPEAAWGLDLYEAPLPEVVQQTALDFYDAFYEAVAFFVDAQLKQHRHLLVLDLHTYNHRRNGPQADSANSETNPEINLGTARLTCPEQWATVLDSLESALRAEGLDTRRNVKFQGGHFSQWLNGRWPGRVCAVAVEVKKMFMDEWTGIRDDATFRRITNALDTAAWSAERALLNLN
ncbi:MAG: N-formylglutamate amidohydrolase [Verrucomicrobia subdivision 3 bacterium]|nr:N-formylglutamate amidohydrolase [Limisphaerales bacterium]